MWFSFSTKFENTWTVKCWERSPVAEDLRREILIFGEKARPDGIDATLMTEVRSPQLLPYIGGVIFARRLQVLATYYGGRLLDTLQKAWFKRRSLYLLRSGAKRIGTGDVVRVYRRPGSNYVIKEFRKEGGFVRFRRNGIRLSNAEERQLAAEIAEQTRILRRELGDIIPNTRAHNGRLVQRHVGEGLFIGDLRLISRGAWEKGRDQIENVNTKIGRTLKRIGNNKVDNNWPNYFFDGEGNLTAIPDPIKPGEDWFRK